MSWARRAAFLALPLAAFALDAGIMVEAAADGRTCANDCWAGVVLLPFAPVVTPIAAAGLGDPDAAQTLASVAAAYAVVGVALVAWWWRMADAVGRRSAWAATGWYLVAIVITSVMKLPALALADVSLGLAMVVEPATAVAVAVAGPRLAGRRGGRAWSS